MIIARLTGGLGNQMFQYAMAQSVAERLKTTLKLDLGDYINGKRQFGLGVFNIRVEKATAWEIFRLKYLSFTKPFDEPYFHFNPDVSKIKNNTYIYTNLSWQTEKYFENIKDVVRKEFTLKEPPEKRYSDIVKDIRESDSVSIHIRRTDYLNKQNTYVILTPEHYEKAIHLMSEKVQNPKYFIFSDDIVWVKENLKIHAEHEFVSNGTYKDFEELVLMSLCRHNIIANSSFSWWGAWLNTNPNKIVVAPKEWLNGDKHNTTDLIPTGWLKL